VTTDGSTQVALVLDSLVAALEKAGEYNAQDQTPPAVILWTDKERQWEPLAPRLREALPQFLTLGPYAPGERTGPAIWIKCMQRLPAGVGIRTALRSACASDADRRLPLAGLRVGAAPATSPTGFVVSSAERPARLISAQTTSSHRSRPPPVRAIPLDSASRRW
jgi:hypothetical protein